MGFRVVQRSTAGSHRSPRHGYAALWAACVSRKKSRVWAQGRTARRGVEKGNDLMVISWWFTGDLLGISWNLLGIEWDFTVMSCWFQDFFLWWSNGIQWEFRRISMVSWRKSRLLWWISMRKKNFDPQSWSNLKGSASQRFLCFQWPWPIHCRLWWWRTVRHGKIHHFIAGKIHLFLWPFFMV